MADVKREYLSSFAWSEDDGSLHFDVPALLKHLHLAVTPENIEAYTRLAQQELSRLLPATPQTRGKDK